MSNIELTGFILTIASFIISTLLGILAIWLTKYFDSKTSETLKEVKELTTEIKGLTNTSIGHQEKITTKMLDKILNQSFYGTQTSPNLDLNDNGNENINNLEKLVTKLFQEQEKKMENFKDQISKISHLKDKDEDEIDILTTLINWTPFPAHYALIYAIYKEKVHTNTELNNIRIKYGIPDYFAGGINHLLEKNVLLGTLESFQINPEYLEPISRWLDENEVIIQQICDVYRLRDSGDQNITKGETTIKVRELSNKLNFKLEKPKMATSR